MLHLKTKCHKTFQECQISQMCNVFSPLEKNIFHGRYHRLHVDVTFTSIDSQHVLVKMRIESCRVDVENFSLTRQNREDCLNAMELFPVSQIEIFDNLIQNFNKVRKEFNINDVSKPVVNNNKTMKMKGISKWRKYYVLTLPILPMSHSIILNSDPVLRCGNKWWKPIWKCR